MRWKKITTDPTNRDAIEQRIASICKARKPIIPSRTNYLCHIVQGKKVLDIGIVDHSLDSNRSASWLHGALVKHAGEILGVDVLENEIKELKNRGYNVKCIDITEEKLSEKNFEVIIAGEVIEHLGCPGKLFESAFELLSGDGVFILTSPNPYTVGRMYQHIQGRSRDNIDHVSLFTAFNLFEFAERSGFYLSSFFGIKYNPHDYKTKFAHLIAKIPLFRFTPEVCCESILYEFRRK